MVLVRALEEMWELRALMDMCTLNELLSMYAGSQGSRNCLLISHTISAFAEGWGDDRARLYHRTETALAFVYEGGQWWWGNEDKQRWEPTLDD